MPSQRAIEKRLENLELKNSLDDHSVTKHGLGLQINLSVLDEDGVPQYTYQIPSGYARSKVTGNEIELHKYNNFSILEKSNFVNTYQKREVQKITKKINLMPQVEVKDQEVITQ